MESLSFLDYVHTGLDLHSSGKQMNQYRLCSLFTTIQKAKPLIASNAQLNQLGEGRRKDEKPPNQSGLDDIFRYISDIFPILNP